MACPLVFLLEEVTTLLFRNIWTAFTVSSPSHSFIFSSSFGKDLDFETHSENSTMRLLKSIYGLLMTHFHANSTTGFHMGALRAFSRARSLLTTVTAVEVGLSALIMPSFL